MRGRTMNIAQKSSMVVGGFISELSDSIQRISLRLSFTRAIRAEVWQLMADLTASGLSDAEAFEIVSTIYKQRRRTGMSNVMLDLRDAIARKDFPVTNAKYATGGEALLFAGYDSSDAARMFAGAARVSRAELLIARAIRAASELS